MSFSWRKVLPLCISLSLTPCLSHAVDILPSFASAEHTAIGNNIYLYFSSNDTGHMGSNLQLPNGLKLTYGELVAMGDFYGNPDQPISKGTTDAERKSRFLSAFNAFATNSAVLPEAKKILEIIRAEQAEVDIGIKNGETPEAIYQRIGHEYDKQSNCATGGGCLDGVWWMEPGRYLKLIYMNYDHFGKNALNVYKLGHQIALATAAQAHQLHDTKQLELAYAINGFACHFLTDRYASGHIRTPRVELNEQVSSSSIGSMLANYMHEEENVNGLHVHNMQGDRWVVYGDKSYFSHQSNAHRKIINTVMQNSADEVFAAYQSGALRVIEPIDRVIPQPDEVDNKSLHDISPLFYWNSRTHKLMRRVDTTNINDKHWTSDWWGWTTLLKLIDERGINTETQAVLLQSEYAEQAIQAGLITNKEFLQYIKR